MSLFLSLLLLSYIVAPIKELANTFFSTISTTSQSPTMANLPSNMDMNINIDIIRGRSAFSSRISPRESLTHSTASSALYHERMETMNNILDEDIQDLVDISQLSYISNKK